MKIEELSERVKKILVLRKRMYQAFNGELEDFTAISIMAGLEDAYNTEVAVGIGKEGCFKAASEKEENE